MQDVQRQLQHAVCQRDAAQEQASSLKQQLDEQTSFLQLVLTRFESALAAVNAMENHCTEMDARAASMQHDWEARMAALQQQHESDMQTAQEDHQQAMSTLQQRHQQAMEEADARWVASCVCPATRCRAGFCKACRRPRQLLDRTSSACNGS